MLRRLKALSAFGVIAAASCGGKAVRLVAGTSDTVVVNDRLEVPIPVYGLDASARRIDVRGVEFQPISENGIALSRDGHVKCSGRADAASRATLGTASTAFTLLCRPIRGFAMHELLRLVVGDPGEDLDATAVGVDGKTVSLLAGSVTVDDTMIVSVHEGRVYPRAPGHTHVRVQAGGCSTTILVEVFERVGSTEAMQPFQQFAVAPLRLVGNELRTWPLAPGRYELLLIADSTSHHQLTLGASESNCAPFVGDRSESAGPRQSARRHRESVRQSRLRLRARYGVRANESVRRISREMGGSGKGTTLLVRAVSAEARLTHVQGDSRASGGRLAALAPALQIPASSSMPGAGHNMTDLDDVTQHLTALQNSPPSELHTHFSRALRRFRFVPRPERRELADGFFGWANETSGTHYARPYAVVLQAMDRFIAEELHESLRLLADARATFVERDDPEGLGLSGMLIGAVYRTFGNFDLGLRVLVEAFELLKASGRYPIFLAATANSMGGIDLELGHLDEALEMFNVTYEESTKAGDFYFGIYGLHGLGRVYARQGNDAEAAEAFHRALELAERHEHPLHIANSLTELATFHFQAGRLDEAETLSEQAHAIRERHHMLAGVVTNCLRLAEIQMARARWTEARRLLERALTVADQLEVKPKMAQVHRQLSDLYERMRLPDKSLFHYKRFHRLREEVEREDNARTLANARAMFEAEQTRKENVVIKAQKAEIELKNRELQDTIDELTRARIGRKAKALTLAVAVVLFIFQDAILRTALRLLNSDNYFLLLAVKMAIIFSLSPINKAIEHHLLKRVMRQERLRRAATAAAVPSAA